MVAQQVPREPATDAVAATFARLARSSWVSRGWGLAVSSVDCALEGSPTTSAVARPDGMLLAFQLHGPAGLLLADIDPSLATGLLASRCKPAYCSADTRP
jgi:hypothetical protein